MLGREETKLQTIPNHRLNRDPPRTDAKLPASLAVYDHLVFRSNGCHTFVFLNVKRLGDILP